MPQMSPMNWMILSISSTILLFLMINLFKMTPSSNYSNTYKMKMLKWKW